MRGSGSASQGCTPSTLSWQPVDQTTDTWPSSLSFTPTNQSTGSLTADATPLEFFNHFVAENVLGLILDEKKEGIHNRAKINNIVFVM